METKFYKLNQLLLSLAILVMFTACSSSQVDESADDQASVETAEATDSVASTDAVPSDLKANEPGSPESAPVVEEHASETTPAPDTSLVVAEAPHEAPEVPHEAPALDSPVAEVPQGDPSLNASTPSVTESDLYGSNSATMPSGDSSLSQSSTQQNHSTPVASNGGNVSGASYTVKRGDTLMKIAFENYGDLYRWKEILENNRGVIQDPNHIPHGTVLSLNQAGMVQVERNGEQYLIKRGETLGIISNNVYGTPRKWKQLWENNRQLIKNPNKIYAGFYLYYIPENRLTHSGSAPSQESMNPQQPEAAQPQVEHVAQPNPQQDPVMEGQATGQNLGQPAAHENSDTRIPASNE